MPYLDKPLRDMTADEIAQLPPERFKELADNHNDDLELRENSRNREDQAVLDKWASKEFLDGPDNPLNYRSERELMQGDRRLSPEQKELLANFEKEPPTPEQQRDIFLTLGSPTNGGYGGSTSAMTLAANDRAVQAYADRGADARSEDLDPFLKDIYCQAGAGQNDELPNPNPEIDKLLDELPKERIGTPLIPAVIEAVKELPEAVRLKMNPFRSLLKYQDSNEDERERTLRDDRW